jgi:G3E family GTPase
MSLPDRIPVFLLSGFLGSGKSTLLNKLLGDPAFKDTAVIINEFGDVPIDHLLVRKGDTTISQVATGCLCCSGVTDLRSTLFDLHCAASGSLCAPFSRVIVEMSGLGDPAPLVNALMPVSDQRDTARDRTVDAVFHLSGFVTLYDIVTGPVSIENHFEGLKQIAFADRIVLTKTDLANDPATKAELAALPGELQQINPSALICDRRNVSLPELFTPRSYIAAGQSEEVAGWLALESVLAREPDVHSTRPDLTGTRHGNGINTFSICHDAPVSKKRFQQFLAVLQNAAGPRLLRAKGIICIAESPDRPLIIHVVQHLAAAPVELTAWPDADRSTRMVFITNGIEADAIEEVFRTIIEGSSLSLTHGIAVLGRKFINSVIADFGRIIHFSRRQS